ncbi:holo-ACP synthase [soil metagenome]
MSDAEEARPGPTWSPAGVGTDLVEIERLRAALARHPGLRTRLFTDREWEYAARHRDPLPHLAARFAAKESVMKALGRGMDAMGFAEIEVVRDDRGVPGIELTGRARALASASGVSGWQLSLTHTASLAQSVAIALAEPLPR